MFLKKNTTKEVLIIIGISIYAFYVNWISGNIGVIPIDSFGFLDTGHSILNGKLPIRDFWIFTGLVVDYMEAGFIYIFGNNWNSHLIHSSFMNILATYIFYIFFKEFELEKKISNNLLSFFRNSMLPCFWYTIRVLTLIYFFSHCYNVFYTSYKKR